MAINTNRNSEMLTGLFSDRESAERAYHGLTERGYTRDDINVVMSDETRKRHFANDGTTTTELGNKAAEGAGIGGAVGGTIGAALAALTAAGSNLVLPGLGLVIAGPLAAAAAGAGAGAATGGLVGALVGWNIPEERVKHYESGIKQGGILMGVTPRSTEDADYFEQHWRSNNAQHLYRPTGGVTGSNADGGTVVGVYDDYADAQSARQALVSAGFSDSDIRLNPDADSSAAQHTATTTDHRSDESGIGGFFRSLFSSDDSRQYHDTYAESLRRGSYVLAVDTHSGDEAERASDILHQFNPVDIDDRASYWKAKGWSGYDAAAPRYTSDEIVKERSAYAEASRLNTGETTRIPVIEESLKVGKREVQRGGVRVFQRVKETPVSESVQLREEHVKVERHPVDKPATAADLAAFKEGSIELRESAEEAVVSKTARVVEEVIVGKKVSEKTVEIADTVRRTDVDIERLGAAGTVTGDDEDYRRHWQSAYAQSGGRYEDYDAAYRYGSTIGSNDRYKNRDWAETEPHLRSDWESSHPGSAWEKVKDAVRYGAERVSGNRRY